MSVNNGERVDVTLPDYSGSAGFVDRGEVAFLSHPAPHNRSLRVGAELEISGQPWVVTGVTTSPYVRGFRVVALRKVPV